MSLEWLPVQLPLTLEIYSPGELDALVPGVHTVSISRADDLSLEIMLESAVDPSSEGFKDPIGKAKAGTTVQTTNIEFESTSLGSVTLEGYHATSWEPQEHAGQTGIVVKGRAWKVLTSQNDDCSSSLTLWLSNIPEFVIWARTTRRVQTAKWTRKRGDVEVTTQAPEGRGTSLDHIEIEIGIPTLGRVQFGAVPRDMADAPDPGFLEFHAGPDGLPSQEIRHSVRNALEFLLGTRLPEIGWSEFSKEGDLLQAGLLSNHLRQAKAAQPPGLFDSGLQRLDETTVQTFVSNYLLLREHYDLDRAVWLFLKAQQAPLDMCAAYVGGAIEVLARGYYDRPENKARSQMLPKLSWKRVHRSIRVLLDEHAESEELRDVADEIEAIKARLGNLNAVSGSKLNLMFLDDLGLEHSDVEHKALLARNNAAHANKLEPSDYPDTHANYRGLQTLFARCLFRLLGVETNYIDYSSLGYPARPISDKQGTG
jgi:hypothetical protein